MSRNAIITLIVICIVMIIAGIFTYSVLQKNTINENTKEIFKAETEDFAYTDLAGNTVSLEQYLGKVLVVTSWASWSPFSKNDLTELNELASRYNKEKFVFIAINRKENKEMADRFMKTLPDLGNLLVILDPSDHFYNAVSGYAMPETVVFDTQGEIVLHIKGVAKVDDIKKELEILVANES